MALKDEGIVDHWRKDDDGFHLMNTSCPYRKAAEASDAPCHADHKVVESLVGVPVEQVSRIVDGHHDVRVRRARRRARRDRIERRCERERTLGAYARAPGREEERMADEVLLKISGLKVAVEGKQILNGVDLTVNRGEVHAIMGPNGSGKSTLANALMGHPRYEVTGGDVLFKGEDILGLPPDERARRGMFLAFQYPTSIPGVTMVNFLRQAMKAVRGEDVPVREFREKLLATMKLLKMDEQFARRYVNEGFSGGEKKRAEILQMGILDPDLAVMDETDSGLDIDALRTVAEGVNALTTPKLGVVLITHYQRLLNYIKPQFVHILYQGRIIQSGGPELALQARRRGLRPDHREVRSRARGGRREGLIMVAKVTPELAEARTATSSASTTTTTPSTRIAPRRG